MAPERRNRLRALGKTRVATSPALRDGGLRDANVTRVTRVTRAYDQPGSAASLPGTGNVRCRGGQSKHGSTLDRNPPHRRDRLRALAKTSTRPAQTSRGAAFAADESSGVTRVTRGTRHGDEPAQTGRSPGAGADHVAEVEERAAMAQYGGGFPARFAVAFARLQL
jgi:hypothetical protein